MLYGRVAGWLAGRRGWLALLFGLWSLVFGTKARRRLIGVDTSGFGVIVGNILGDKPNSRSRRVESSRGLESFPRSVRRGALRAACTVQPEFLHTVVGASYYIYRIIPYRPVTCRLHTAHV